MFGVIYSYYLYKGGNLLKYNNIIWDFDGTLFDTYSFMSSVFCQVLEEYNIKEPIHDIKSSMKISMGYTIEQYKVRYNLKEDFFEKYQSLRKNRESQEVKPFDYIVSICGDICKNNGKNYLFTHRGKSTHTLIDEYGLKEYFSEIITSEYDFQRKPSPEAVVYLMNKHGFSQKSAIFIGDRDIDIQSGKNAGISTCFFSEEGETLDIADYNIRSMNELYDVLYISRTK